MERDAVDWILFVVQLGSLVGTAAAALLATVTIRQAKKQARAAQEALVRERRIDFELDVLKDLAEYNGRPSNVSFASERFRMLAAMLPVDLVPLARAAVKLAATPDAEASVQDAAARLPSSTVRDTLRDEIAAEILQAIQRRITERH